MKYVLFFIAVVLSAQEPKKDTLPMSEPAVAKIAVAQLKAQRAQQSLQQFMDQMLDQIRKIPAYQTLEKANTEAQAALTKTVEAERKAAKAEGHDADVEAGVWRKKVEAAKK